MIHYHSKITETENIVSLSTIASWRELDLHWPEDEIDADQNTGNTIVFGNFSQEGLVFKTDMRVIEYLKTFAENFPLASGGSLSAAQFLELFSFKNH